MSIPVEIIVGASIGAGGMGLVLGAATRDWIWAIGVGSFGFTVTVIGSVVLHAVPA